MNETTNRYAITYNQVQRDPDAADWWGEAIEFFEGTEDELIIYVAQQERHFANQRVTAEVLWADSVKPPSERDPVLRTLIRSNFLVRRFERHPLTWRISVDVVSPVSDAATSALGRDAQAATLAAPARVEEIVRVAREAHAADEAGRARLIEDEERAMLARLQDKYPSRRSE